MIEKGIITNTGTPTPKGGNGESTTIEGGHGSVHLKPNVFRYHLITEAATKITCEDISQFPLGYTASIVIYSANKSENFGVLKIISNVLKDTADDGMPLTELTNSIGNNGALLCVYKTDGADKFNWHLTRELDLIIENDDVICLTPSVKSYCLKTTISTRIESNDISTFPNGYHATIVVSDTVSEAALSEPIQANIFKDESDDGVLLSSLTNGTFEGGGVIHVYKVANADKFNWYLSTEGGGNGEQGPQGVYTGTEEPTDENVTIWLNPNGEPTNLQGEWIDIADITMDSVPVSSILLDKDINGNAFNCDKIFAKLTMPSGFPELTGVYVGCRNNDPFSQPMYSFDVPSQVRVIDISIELVSGKFVKFDYQFNGDTPNFSQNLSRGSIIKETDYTSLYNFRISAGYDYTIAFPFESNLKVWGLKATSEGASVLKVKDENGNWVEIPALKGNKGDAYVPTEADKTEIANAVLNALPLWEGGAY